MSEGTTAGKLLLTYENIATMLGVNKRTLRRMIETGDFPAPTMYGRQPRWIAATVDEFLRAVQIVQAVKKQSVFGVTNPVDSVTNGAREENPTGAKRKRD